MKLFDIRGIPRFKNVSDYRVNWSGKSKSEFQRVVKIELYPFWQNSVVYEEFPVYGTRLTLDFFCALYKGKRYAVEVQGPHHTSFNKGFHKNQFDYLEQMKRDEMKRKFCELNNITLLEIFWEERNKISNSFLKNLGL